MHSNVKHIFFDLDRTLWDFESNSTEALRDLFDEFDLGAKGNAPVDQFVKRYKFHNDVVWDLYRANKISKGRLRKERFKRALIDIGIDDNALTNQMSKTYMEIAPTKSKLVEGARETLDALAGNYKMHLLTNGFQKAQTTKLKVCDIAHYFDHVITSERASARKPDPRMYEFAMNCSKAKPDESLMIGDHYEIDILGAKGAGWSVIHFNVDGDEHDLPAVKELKELIGLLL